MEKQLIVILMLLVGAHTYAQEQVGVHRTERIVTEFSVDKLYNKKTGEKVSQAEFEKLVSNNPNLPFETVYDNKGKAVKFLYDPDNANAKVINTRAGGKVKVGDYYPELVFRTVDDEVINLKDLKGKMVILRFEMEANTFRFKKHEIAEMDEAINQTQRQSEIEAIIVFAPSKKQVLEGFDLKNSNFKLVPDGHSFHDMLNIRNFPSTVILDKEGHLMKEFSYSDEIDIVKLLNKS